MFFLKSPDPHVHVVRCGFVATKIRVQQIAFGLRCSTLPRHGYHLPVPGKQIRAGCYCNAANRFGSNGNGPQFLGGHLAAIIYIGIQAQGVLVPGPAKAGTVLVVVRIVVGKAIQLVDVVLVSGCLGLVNGTAVKAYGKFQFTGFYQPVAIVADIMLAAFNGVAGKAGSGFVGGCRRCGFFPNIRGFAATA